MTHPLLPPPRQKLDASALPSAIFQPSSPPHSASRALMADRRRSLIVCAFRKPARCAVSFQSETASLIGARCPVAFAAGTCSSSIDGSGDGSNVVRGEAASPPPGTSFPTPPEAASPPPARVSPPPEAKMMRSDALDPSSRLRSSRRKKPFACRPASASRTDRALNSVSSASRFCEGHAHPCSSA